MMPIATPTEQQRSAGVFSPAALRMVGRQRLRVLHVLSCFGVGGTEYGVAKVIQGLGWEAFEHRLCAVRGCRPGFDAEERFRAPSYVAGRNERGFQFPLFRLMRILREYRPHIVHTRNFGSLEAVAAARLARVPVVIHSEHGYEVATLAGLPLRRRLLCHALYVWADAVCTVTADLRRYHARQAWLPPQRFRILYNGVDTNRFSPCQDRAARERERLGIPADRVVVGTVGRQVPIKGTGTLLEALASLIRRGLDVHGLIVGDGPEMPRLQAQADKTTELQGRVTFTGNSDSVPAMLNVMDVFVLASLSEGMSNTILEAMASGLPVVVSRAGGNPELLEEGRSGLLFAPGDGHALAQDLALFAGDPVLRRQMGAEARQRAIGQFSLDGMMRRYSDLYLELARSRGLLARN